MTSDDREELERVAVALESKATTYRYHQQANADRTPKWSPWYRLVGLYGAAAEMYALAAAEARAELDACSNEHPATKP